MRFFCILITALCAVFVSCKRTKNRDLIPLSSDWNEGQKVLSIADSCPSMRLVTDNVVHLQAEGQDKSLTNGIIQEGESLVMTYRYLPLETTEECLIGKIEKIDSDDSSVFIFDRDNSSAMRFSLEDGSFICKYGSRGRGPGEFVSLNYMAVDKRKKEVCLLDFDQYKLMYFNYDGTFLREEPQFYGFSQMEFCGERMLLSTRTSENTMAPSINHNALVLAEQNQLPLFKGFPYPEHFYDKFHYTKFYSFVRSGDDIYYNHVLSDTIWQIKEDGECEAKYVVKFPGRDNLFDEKDFQQISEEDYEAKRSGVPCFTGNYTITHDFVIAEVFNGSTIVYCTSTGHYYYGYPGNKYFDGGASFRGKFTLDGTSFVDVLQPFELLKKHAFFKEIYSAISYDAYWNKRLNEEERRLLQKMTPEDNPILVIADLEPF